eukprot:259463_1
MQPSVDLNKYQWTCMESNGTAWRKSNTIWYYQKESWERITYATDTQLNNYMKQIKNSQRNNAIHSTYKATTFSPHIYDIIIDYLPLFNRNYIKSFINEYPGLKELVNAKKNCWKCNKFVLDIGMAYINRFLFATKLIKNKENIDMNLGIQGALKQFLENVYWYRMGTKRFESCSNDKCHIFPLKTADILGSLKNGKWFYYKDANPNMYTIGCLCCGGYQRTHKEYMYLIANDLKSLLKQMDIRDIELFIKNEKRWKHHNDGEDVDMVGLLTPGYYDVIQYENNSTKCNNVTIEYY